MWLKDLPGQTAVRFGSLFWTPKEIGRVLAQTVRPFILETTDPLPLVGRVGTTTLVSHQGSKYAVATRHQLSVNGGVNLTEEDVDAVRIGAKEGGRLINLPVNKCVFETGNPDEAFHELVFFCVDEKFPQVSRDSYYFANLSKIDSGKYLKSVAYGLPHLNEQVDYDNSHLKIHIQEIWCEYDANFKTHNRNFRKLNIINPEGKFYDGMSGGAVFSFYRHQKEFLVLLDGVIVRAGNGQIYIVDTEYLEQMFGA
ncbi:hypothetical protein [Maricaulis sp.]|uniref:hypothetical protein n=1 Tax=Maricaulis sp. TaxID=1486257 RepID=UPI001B025559|nr:hypothetical protein [Maricaulis sp.]MBO6763884.1 hypothetical protein [Maricaulis sp.]